MGQLELICAQHGFLSKPGCILFYRHSQMGCGRRGGGERCGAGVGPMVVHDLTARGAQTLMVGWFVVIPIAGGRGGCSNACAERKGVAGLHAPRVGSAWSQRCFDTVAVNQ